MLKSLYSGVSGLQSHQVAMDVESNNIANVNTTGFKYSRANFSDLLAQTKAIATAPQGDLGGKNAVQVGLGSTVSSTTRIFSQGSVQNTDKNTDLAIQGDGFFMISPDAGSTYQYTRAGDFKFDANGNFVDNNGYIVQGWLRDETTGKVDSTAPITNINIAPGLTTPANPSAEVVIKANLNSGIDVESFSPAYEVKSGTPPSIANPGTPDAIDANGNAIESGDMGVMFNGSGEAFSLQTGQGIWVSFLSATKNDSANNSVSAGATELDITFTLDDGSTQQITTTGGAATNTAAQNGNRFAAAINAQESITGITASYDTVNNKINLTNTNEKDAQSHNIRLTATGAGDGSGLTTGTVTTAYTYTYDPSGSNATIDTNKTFTTIADLRYAMEQQARAVGNHSNELTSTVSANSTTAAVTSDFTIGGTNVNTVIPAGTSAEAAAQLYVDAINLAAPAGVTASRNGSTLILSNSTGANITLDTTNPGLDAGLTGLPDNTTTDIPLDDGISNDNNIEIAITDEGKFSITNPGGSTDGDYDINLKVTAFSNSTNNIVNNEKFTDAMQAMNAVLEVGSTGVGYSQSFNAATHSSSIDIFDSLGSKHTLTTSFRKTAVDSATGSTWDMTITVPSPAEISTVAPYNETTGTIRFNNDGSLATYNPTSLSFTGNNGSSPNQQINLSLGTANDFDGMTSYDSDSTTSGISQDGYTGGDLVGIRIDQSGTLVGSFSNGRSFGLAQVAMAKFTNNEGLSVEGGNVYNQTANSGEPIIGTAATAGRGFIQASALEASNVDLSSALTQLIVIQRGYQANGKTITTSDTLLETLIGLKR